MILITNTYLNSDGVILEEVQKLIIFKVTEGRVAIIPNHVETVKKILRV